MAGNMYIEVSDRCMFRCVTCPKGQSGYPTEEGYITAEQVMEQVTKMQMTHCIDSVTLSGGEPLLNPNLFSIMEAIDRKGLSITMLSNLYCLDTPEIAGCLKNASKRLSVVVALHAANAEEHDKITRKPGSFEHALRGITYLRNEGIRVIIKVILNDETCERLQDIASLSRAKWGRGVVFNLCGLDLCGIAKEERSRFSMDFSHQAECLEAFLSHEEKLYKNELPRMVSITEYPLCCVDPYYWRLVHQNRTQLTAYIAEKQMCTAEALRVENTCAPHAKKCKACLAHHICPGVWYSVYDSLGEAMVSPYVQE